MISVDSRMNRAIINAISCTCAHMTSKNVCWEKCRWQVYSMLFLMFWFTFRWWTTGHENLQLWQKCKHKFSCQNVVSWLFNNEWLKVTKKEPLIVCKRPPKTVSLPSHTTVCQWHPADYSLRSFVSSLRGRFTANPWTAQGHKKNMCMGFCF